MLTLIINNLIFLCIFALQLFCRKKVGSETFDKKVSYFFVALYILYIFCCAKFGVVSIFGELIAIDMIIFFIIAFVLNIKQCIIIVLATSVMFLIFRDLYNNDLTYITIDILIMLIYTALGIFSKKKIYFDSHPSVISSVFFSLICTTLYALTFTLICLASGKNDVFSNDYLPFALSVRIIKGAVLLACSILFLDIFRKEERKNSSRLIEIFVKKYSVLVTIFTIFAVIFCIIFNFLFINFIYENVLRLNFEMAKEDLQKSYEKYSESYIERDDTLIAEFSNWTLDLAGAVCVLDKNFKYKNDVSRYKDERINFDDEMFAASNFKNIINYKMNNIFTYKNDGRYYMVIYDKIGSNYLLAFFVYDLLVSQVLIPTTSSLFIIIVNVLFVFLLAYGLFKKYIVDKLDRVNNKLNKITEGNYDVIFTDVSSDEFKKLSYSINHTVNKLKTNIEAVENKNKEELELARRIQVSQLPANTDVTIGYTSYGLNIPAEDVGGDFYDDVNVDDLRRIVLVADVSGKGIPGALFMMKAKHTIINLAKQYESMEVIFEKVNKVLSHNNPSFMFVTCFAIMIDLTNGNLSMINAGHNKPILIKNDGTSEFIDMPPSHILGIDSSSKYESMKMTLEEGDRIVLYTDGVNEAANTKKEQYGNERFLNAVKNINSKEPESICHEIVSDVQRFAGSEPQSDDITIFTIRYNANKNSIKLKSNNDAIDKGKTFIDKFAKVYRVNKDLARNLKVVFDEIACNITKYAYKDDLGEFVFEINIVNDDTIEMVFIDSGPEFDPTKYDNDSKNRSAEDKINGGMGIMFCKNMMDKCVYSREDNKNVLKMYKKYVSMV